MAFGLTGAPNSFQGAMNTTLHPLVRKCVLVFFDNILIYSSTYEEHLQHLEQVFGLLSKDVFGRAPSGSGFSLQYRRSRSHRSYKSWILLAPNSL